MKKKLRGVKNKYCENFHFGSHNPYICTYIRRVWSVWPFWTIIHHYAPSVQRASPLWLYTSLCSYISGGFGTSYVDQSYWQSSVAAKPREGVLGFLAGGIVWFSIPFALATTMGLAYIALSARQGQPLLVEEDVDIGTLYKYFFCGDYSNTNR